MEPPVAESFSYNGKTYTLQPNTLTGENVDHLNAAAHRSRVAKALSAVQMLNRQLEECRESGERASIAEVKSEVMKPVSQFTPLELRELGSVIKDDPTVVADCIFRMSPECESLAEAEEIVRNYPTFHEISLLCFMSSGVKQVGKSLVLQAILQPEKTDSGGGGQTSAGASSDDVG